MNKIILNDGTKIEITYRLGLTVTTSNKTISELEDILTVDNLNNVQFTCNEEICGKYKNLELVSLTKNYITKEITIKLKEKTIA